MKLYTCPKCGRKMIETAPNFCPDCGCSSSEFVIEEVERSEEVKSTPKVDGTENQGKKGFSFLGCLGIGFLILVVVFIIISLAGSGSSSSSSKSSTKIENYNDNSQLHQIFAKNWLVDHNLKPRMNDDKSYEEVKYDVSYDYKAGEYIVIVTYRGKNAYGAKVLNTCKGTVKFTDDGRVQSRIISNE